MPGLIETYGFGVPRNNGSVPSFDPSSYFTGGTKGPDWDFNSSANVLNGSATPATNGQTIATVNDSGTAGIDMSQGTDANRPTLVTNASNGRSGALCDSTDVFTSASFNSLTNGANSLTGLVIASFVDGTTGHTPIRQYDNGFANLRFQMTLAITNLRPALSYTRDGVDYGNLRNGGSDITTGAFGLYLFRLDFLNGQTGARYNTAASVAFGAAGGTTVAGAMTATDSAFTEIMRTSKGTYLRIYLHKNAYPDATQLTNLEADAKAYYGLVGY